MFKKYAITRILSLLFLYFILFTGETIDITAYEVLGIDFIKELKKAYVEGFGGTSVNESYLDFIKSILGDVVTKKIHEGEEDIFLETCTFFELAKSKFNPNSDGKVCIRIPISLAEIYESIYPGKRLQSIKSGLIKSRGHVTVTFFRDKLRLASNDFESFFDYSVLNITNHLSKFLEQEKGKGITSIILVGGYAESQVLTNAVKSKFPQMHIIKPEEAATSVLRGALILGHSPQCIRQRFSKYTFGISVRRFFDPSKHDEKYKYEDHGEVFCSLFSKIVERGQEVSPEDYLVIKTYRASKRSSLTNTGLYRTENPNPKYVDEAGFFFIGNIVSNYQGHSVNENIEIRGFFGLPELTFRALNLKSQTFVQCYMDYDFDFD
jgi:hypothetical protein